MVIHCLYFLVFSGTWTLGTISLSPRDTRVTSTLQPKLTGTTFSPSSTLNIPRVGPPVEGWFRLEQDASPLRCPQCQHCRHWGFPWGFFGKNQPFFCSGLDVAGAPLKLFWRAFRECLWFILVLPILLLGRTLSTLLGITPRYLLVDPGADLEVRFLCKLTGVCELGIN